MNQFWDVIREPLYAVASVVATWLLGKMSFSQINNKLIAEAIDMCLINIFEIEREYAKDTGASKFDLVTSSVETSLSRRQTDLVIERYGSVDGFVQFVYDKYASATLDAKKIKKCQ